MENTRRSTIFAIDGYEVSASFADDRNTTALHHAKQILLSSFANNTPNSSNKCKFRSPSRRCTDF